MKAINYTDVTPTHFNNDVAKDVSGRVVIGKADGANNFCMRVFEVGQGGNTPRHTHDWEHEIFFHAGTGEVLLNGEWTPVKAGSVVFIPGTKEHQIKNTGIDPLTFVCLVPDGAPEL